MANAEATDLQIDPERLRADIQAVNRLGTFDGQPGINRPAFSDADMAARRWLMERLAQAGLAARMDAIGNVFGRWDVGSGPALLIGSHLDTVPEGGPFDGTLGVCAALEAVRAMQTASLLPVRPIEVICTADEEGRFGGMLGSQALTGEVDAAWIERAADADGVKLSAAMREQGLEPLGDARLDLSQVAAFLELHIEQGPILAEAGLFIGIAEAVSGVINWTVTLTGAANHSGTTPMGRRRDAFQGLAAFAGQIEAVIAEVGGAESRLTIGKVELAPNFPHSIPGQATFSLVIRDPDAGMMDCLEFACRHCLDRIATSRRLSLTIEEQSWLPPTALSGVLVDRLSALAAASGIAAKRMVSGAGHDAQTFARHVPAALVFVPSVGGVSHAPDEWTEWTDVEAGALFFARAVAAISVEPD